MKTILLAGAATLLIAGAAAALLAGGQRQAYEAYATSGTRVSQPGHNLVGPAWSGRT